MKRAAPQTLTKGKNLQDRSLKRAMLNRKSIDFHRLMKYHFLKINENFNKITIKRVRVSTMDKLININMRSMKVKRNLRGQRMRML